MKVALALGGGGARGLAHIGVLKALDEMGVKFDFIVGTSAGGLVAGLYAVYRDYDTIVSKAREIVDSPMYKELDLSEFVKEGQAGIWGRALEKLKETKLITRTLISRSVVKENALEELIDSLFPEVSIENLSVKTAYVAVDIVTGTDIIIRGGSLRKAVRATGAIPGVFPPVEMDDMILVDGGITQRVPTIAARLLGAQIVIGVEVGKSIERKEDFDQAVDIMLRSSSITSNRLARFINQFADVMVEPQVGHIEWYEFERLDETIELGYEATIKRKKEIMEVFSLRYKLQKKIWALFSKLEYENIKFYPEEG